MLLKAIVTALSLTMVLCGCVSIQHFEPNAAGNHVCELANGNKICVSKQQDSTVMVSIHKSRDGYMPLLVLIANESPEPFDVIPTDIEVTCRSDHHAAYPVKVYSAVELEHRLNITQGWVREDLALVQAKRVEENNDVLKSDVYLKDFKEMSSLTQEQTMETTGFLNKILRDKTLFPGQFITGIVWAEYKDADTYTVTYEINNDVHTLEFNRIVE
ncbi:MAG: hypothetical protein ABSH12_00420 [Endomicrobiales bacterium]|jgi:hypothetical protein